MSVNCHFLNGAVSRDIRAAPNLFLRRNSTTVISANIIVDELEAIENSTVILSGDTSLVIGRNASLDASSFRMDRNANLSANGHDSLFFSSS